MKKMNLKSIQMLMMALVFAFFSCTSEEPEEELEQELITDVTLEFTEVDANGTAIGNPFEVRASDPQGIELGSPVIQTITLQAGKRYRLEISLFNSIENEDITKEVEEEDDEHQFYFLGTSLVGSNMLTYTYDDADDNGNPIGLKGFVQVAQNPSVNSGTFRVILRHDLDKNFPGADNPNFENFVQAGGETDLDISFPVVLN